MLRAKTLSDSLREHGYAVYFMQFRVGKILGTGHCKLTLLSEVQSQSRAITFQKWGPKNGEDLISMVTYHRLGSQV